LPFRYSTISLYLLLLSHYKQQNETVILSLSFNLQDQNIILQDGKITAVKTTESKECELSENTYSVHTVGLYLILKLLNGIDLIWDKYTKMSVILDPLWQVYASLASGLIPVTETQRQVFMGEWGQCGSSVTVVSSLDICLLEIIN
jgi:hypothetical protein